MAVEGRLWGLLIRLSIAVAICLGLFGAVVQGQGGKPKDVIFLVDVSPSVCSEEQVGKVPGCTVVGADPRGLRSKLVQQAGARILEQCPSCRLGLIVFGGEAEVYISLTSSWPSTPPEMEVITYTDFRPPIQLALEEFKRHRTWEEGREPIIVLISDGDPTVSSLTDIGDVQAAAGILRGASAIGRDVEFYTLALEQVPERWAMWRSAFGDMLPSSHLIFVTDVESAVEALLSSWVFPVKEEVPVPTAYFFKLVAPRTEFVERWSAEVCIFPPLRAGKVISGTLALTPAGGGPQVEVPLLARAEDTNCLATAPLPSEMRQGEYELALSQAYYSLNGKPKRVADKALGKVRLLRRVHVSLDAPKESTVGKEVRLRVEVQNAAILPQPLTPAVLDINVNGREVAPGHVESKADLPQKGDHTFYVTLAGNLFQEPSTVRLQACVRHTQTSDGVLIPTDWRCSSQEVLAIIPPSVAPPPTRGLSGWLRTLLWSVGLLLVAALAVFFGRRAYRPELLLLESRLTRDPERALRSLTTYLTEEEARVQRAGSRLLRDMVVSQQGRRGYLFQRLFSLGRRSVTKRQILAMGMSRRWQEKPQDFLKDAGLFARELPLDFFLFVALSPFGANGKEGKSINWHRYEDVLSRAQSWVPATARRRDLRFVRFVRRFGVSNLLRGEGISVDETGLLGPVQEIAQHKPHPATVLAAIYYEMGEGLKADVPAQDRPRVEELLQDALDILNHIHNVQPLDEESCMYWESARRFISFLQECWTTGRVPPSSPKDFKPFAPWADKVIEVLRLAEKYKGKRHIPAEVKRHLVHEMEAIDPPFRSLVAHIVSVWGVI